VEGTVAGPGEKLSLSFPSVLATGAGGVQASTAADLSFSAPDPEVLGAAAEPGDAFAPGLP